MRLLKWVRETVARATGRVPCRAYETLAGFLHRPAYREQFPLSQTAIVGRQGCAAADARALREELRIARGEIIQAGGSEFVELDSWQLLMQEYRENERTLDDRELICLTFVGELDRVRDQLAALVPSLRASQNLGGRPNHHCQALAIVLDWVTTGTFDRNAAAALTASSEQEQNSDEVTWLMFFEPSDAARARLAHLEKKLQQRKRRWHRGDDGDEDEWIGRESEKLDLLAAVVASWDDPRGAADLAGSFDHYQRATLDPFSCNDALFAAALQTLTLTPELSPDRALSRLRSFVNPPLDAPPIWREEDDAGLQALDQIAHILDKGRGLTVRGDGDAIALDATPQKRDPDFL